MLKFEVNGREIKRRRLNLVRGATQKEFAYTVGVSERRLREIENTTASVPSDLLDRIARALSIHPSLLYAAPPPVVEDGTATRAAVPSEFFIPRHDTGIADVVESEAQLFELATKNKIVLCHARVGLNAETGPYLEELFEILSSLTWSAREGAPASGSASALTTQRRIRELLVLLKGNDVWVYQTTNLKQLPERDVIPDTPDPFHLEPQLIIAAGPPGEYGETSISVPIDNGQPRICRPLTALEKMAT